MESGLVLLAFVLQTLLVFAGNSRGFGLLSERSGWRTNVEMSDLYASLVTPAGWAFAIWGIIYLWESIAVVVLSWFGVAGLACSGDAECAHSVLCAWVAANTAQGVWAVLFARQNLAASACAISAIPASLVWMGTSIVATPLGYAIVGVPLWLHAGWTTAAALVNWNLLLVGGRASAALQLAAAFATCFAALLAATAAVAAVGAPALPYLAALAWALAAIKHKLGHPDESAKNNPAIGAVGEVGREALELTSSMCSRALLLLGLALLVKACFTGAFLWGHWLPTATRVHM